jgi:hypothetical protein
MHRLSAIVVCTWLSVGVAACSGDSDPGIEHDAQQGDEPEDDFKGCPPDVPVFGPGLKAEAEGEPHSVRLISSEPEEPERYRNDWVVELTPPDAQLVRGQTFMPVHGHDGRVQPEFKALETAGQFAIERLNFTMRGPWEVRLWLSSAAAAEEYVVFKVCVAK